MEGYESIIIKYENLKELSLGENIKVFLTVQKDDLKYEFLINRKTNSKKMIVFGSGAYDYNSMKPPVFQRFSWEKFFTDNTVFFNDPTLYLGEINVGWGVGTKEENCLPIIANILKKIAEILNIENEGISIYGSSAGGFMAIMLATWLKGSKAIVNNPQIMVRNSRVPGNDFLHNHINRLMKAMGEDIPKDEWIKKYIYRLDCLELFKSLNYVPNIIYLQNMACNYDVYNQLVPFMEGLNSFSDDTFHTKITTIMYFNKEQGHNPLGQVETIHYIRDYC